MNSALDRLLERFPNARRYGGGWSARCPAHDDRSPSLSIREGHEGVLIHCFAGCSTSEIVAALGLEMRDLFNEARHRNDLPIRPQRPPTPAEIEAALRAHLQRILGEEAQRLGYSPPITSRHHNAAREAVSRTLGVRIPLAMPAWWEVDSGYNQDPQWRFFCEYALVQIVRERYGFDTLPSVATLNDRMDAHERAASWIRDEARRTLALPKAEDVA